MIEVREMDDREINDVLTHVGYGHLACSLNDEPYLVPIHYAYAPPNFYVYTTEGKKSEMIGKNPRVCLQVEDVTDNKHWKSVIVTGRAQRKGQPKAWQRDHLDCVSFHAVFLLDLCRSKD